MQCISAVSERLIFALISGRFRACEISTRTNEELRFDTDHRHLVDPTMAFVSAAGAGATATFTGTPVRRSVCGKRPALRAGLDLVPGVPSGQDARDNAPLRHFVPRPVETYDDRAFSTKLPDTWSGDDFETTIGALDVPPLTKESIEEARLIPVDAASTSAFLEFSDMVRDERAALLARQAERNAVPQSGRPTCGVSEGREYVSNAYDDGVKCVEYWGTPNGPVNRLFGGDGA